MCHQLSMYKELFFYFWIVWSCKSNCGISVIEWVFHNLKFSFLASLALYWRYFEKLTPHKHNHEVNIRKSHVIPIFLKSPLNLSIIWLNLIQICVQIVYTCLTRLNLWMTQFWNQVSLFHPWSASAKHVSITSASNSFASHVFTVLSWWKAKSG